MEHELEEKGVVPTHWTQNELREIWSTLYGNKRVGRKGINHVIEELDARIDKSNKEILTQLAEVNKTISQELATIKNEDIKSLKETIEYFKFIFGFGKWLFLFLGGTSLGGIITTYILVQRLITGGGG